MPWFGDLLIAQQQMGTWFIATLAKKGDKEENGHLT